jgi:hypothetical protein
MDIFFCLTFLPFSSCAIFQSISRTKWTGLSYYIFVFVNIFLYLVNYAKSVFVYIVYMYETASPHNLLFPSLYLRSYGIAGNIVLTYAMVYQVLVRYLSKAGKVQHCVALSLLDLVCIVLLSRFRISVWVEWSPKFQCRVVFAITRCDAASFASGMTFGSHSGSASVFASLVDIYMMSGGG